MQSAVDTLTGRGEAVTVRAIVAVSGGSYSTVGELLARIQAEQVADARAAHAAPPAPAAVRARIDGLWPAIFAEAREIAGRDADALRAQLTELQEALDATLDQNQNFERQLEEAEGALARLRREDAAQAQALAVATAKLEMSERRLAETIASLSQATDGLSLARAEAVKAAAEAVAAARQADAAEKRAASLEAALRDARDAGTAQTATQARLDAALARLEAQVAPPARRAVGA